MKNLVIYINESRTSLPEELKQYEEIAKFGDWDELNDYQWSEIAKSIIAIDTNASWKTTTQLLQLLYDRDLDGLCALGKAYYNKGDKVSNKLANKIDKAITKLPNKFTDNYSTLGSIINHTIEFLFNRLNPKKEFNAYHDDIGTLWLNIRYFDKYFTDKEKEAQRQAVIDSLPKNMKDWYDKCVNFCYAGAWNYTDPKLSYGDFMPAFINDAKKFDFTKIKGLHNRASKVAESINKLIKAFINNNDVVSAYNELLANNDYAGAYWYQTAFGRDENGGFIVEAALLISAAYYFDAKNLWYTADWTPEVMKSKL